MPPFQHCDVHPFIAIAEKLLIAVQLIVLRFEAGRAADSRALRAAMESASDAEGVWDRKSAYDVSGAVQILFLRKYAGPLLRKHADQQAGSH